MESAARADQEAGYATGVFSSRKLERATYDSVAFPYIAANDHPDHDTIATAASLPQPASPGRGLVRKWRGRHPEFLAALKGPRCTIVVSRGVV